MADQRYKHTIYYQFAKTNFKLETNEADLDSCLDQFNMLEVTFIQPTEFDERLIEKVDEQEGLKLSHYKMMPKVELWNTFIGETNIPLQP
jgi:hypothetical protein